MLRSAQFMNTCRRGAHVLCEQGGTLFRAEKYETYLEWVSGIMVGGFGGCCGTMRPRRVDAAAPLWCKDMSPADRSEMTPVPSAQFGWAVVKHTRPPCWKGKYKIR